MTDPNTTPVVPAGWRLEHFEGTVSEYQGKPVEPAITYAGDAVVPATVDAAKASEHWPNESGVLKGIVAKIVAAAKSAEYQEVTKGLKKTYEDSPEYKRKNLVASLIAAGKDKAEAEKLADSLMA